MLLIADLTMFEVHSNYTMLDKAFFFQPKITGIFFLFLDGNISCGYSLDVPQCGGCNEYPQPMFSSRNKKNII